MDPILRKWLCILTATLYLAAGTYWSAAAQEPDISYTFKHLDIQDGLASNHVSAILQDRKGFVWIASTALQRYDGSNLVTVASFDRVPGSIYYDDICLCEDRKGRIWMGAPDNVRFYDPVTATVRTIKVDILPAAPGSLYCSRIIEDHAGVIWATTQEGLLQYNEKAGSFVKPPGVPETLRREMYSAIIEDDAGNLWVSGRNGIFMLDRSRQHVYSAANNPMHHPVLNIPSSVRRFYIDRQGRMWIAARLEHRFYRYTPGRQQLEEYAFPGRVMTTDIQEDLDGNLWTAMELGGVFRFDSTTNSFSTNIKADNSDDLALHYNFEVNCFLSDRDGHLWIGSDHGVNILSLHNRSFRIMDHRTEFKGTADRLPRNEVTDLFQDSHGNMYAGYWGQGFSWMDSGLGLKRNFLHSEHDRRHSIPEPRSLVWSFAEMRNGRVLVGQENGWLSVFDPQQGAFTAHHHPPVFDDQTLMSLLPEGDTSVWIGLYKRGLARWDTRRDSFYACPAVLDFFRRPITIMDIAPQHDSLLWLATSAAGLIRFNRRTQQVTRAESFRYEQQLVNNITCLHFLDDSLLVAGTDHGLWVYNTHRRFAQPLKINGTLFDEWVLSMQADGAQGLWFTTQYGFYRFNSRYFNLETFVQTDDIIDNTRKVRRRITRLKNGRLMVGAADHFVVFDPAMLEVAPPPPDVTIIALRAMDSTVQVAAGGQPVQLPYRQNFISIEFKSLQYHHEKIKYLYQLVGVDENWVKADGPLVARYTNLPPGNYTFRVRSVNTAGTFSAGITELSINILPAFWQTTWFRVLCLLLAAALIYLYFRLRIHFIKKEARRRTAIQQQIAQLEMKALRAQMNPHFIFNALNSIQTFMMKSETEQALSYLGRFARLIRNVLDNSAQNSIPISKEVQMLENYMELEKLRFTDQFDCSITIDPALDADFTEIPTMVLQPFVENAIWHGLLYKKEKGRVEISFHKMQDRVLCIIEDNGIGRDRAAALRQQSGQVHHSRGLQITGDRLALYNSRFNLDATFEMEDLYDEIGLPCGTRVRVWFPLIEE